MKIWAVTMKSCPGPSRAVFVDEEQPLIPFDNSRTITKVRNSSLKRDFEHLVSDLNLTRTDESDVGM